MKCLVSRQITELAYPVRFMYREEPDHQLDSGWRFLSGFEDDEYMGNADNICVRLVSDVVRLDPAITAFMDHKPGVAFERLAETEVFTKV